MPNITTNHAIIWHKYQSWYLKIVSNFSRQKITCNNLGISLLVFEPNITTNHAITYTYYKQIKWNFDGSRLPLHSRKRLKATVSGLKKNGRHEEKGRKTTILNRSRNKCILLYTDDLYSTDSSDYSWIQQSCNFHLGDSLGDELHSVWLLFYSLIALLLLLFLWQWLLL